MWAEYFGSLSCWNILLLPTFSWQWSMFPETNAKFSTPDTVTAPQNIYLTPSWLTVETECLGFIAIFHSKLAQLFHHFQKCYIWILLYKRFVSKDRVLCLYTCERYQAKYWVLFTFYVEFCNIIHIV